MCFQVRVPFQVRRKPDANNSDSVTGWLFEPSMSSENNFFDTSIQLSPVEMAEVEIFVTFSSLSENILLKIASCYPSVVAFGTDGFFKRSVPAPGASVQDAK